jgi:1-acyl-sn-glycerol-3-phosphate acyltransferase
VRLPPYHWWRTLFFLIPAISVYTIVLGTLSIASSLFDRSGSFAHRCARLWARLILRTTGVRVRASGIEHLDPAGSYVVVSNHQSIYDIPVVFDTLPLQLRIVAKASLGRFPFLGWHLRRTGHLLVRRESPGVDVLERMARLAGGGGTSLVVFPEGTRSSDGRVGSFKGGPFLIAIASGLPVLPVSIVGSRHVMMKGRLMTCPGEVDLAVHEPIPTLGLERDDARALANRARDIVARGVAVAEPTAPWSTVAGQAPV